MAERELDLLAVVAHLLEPRRLEPVAGPRSDPELRRSSARTASSRSGTTSARLLERGVSSGDSVSAHPYSATRLRRRPRAASTSSCAARDRPVGDLGDPTSRRSARATRRPPRRRRRPAGRRRPSTSGGPAGSRRHARKSSSSIAIVAASTSANGRSYSVPSGAEERCRDAVELEAAELASQLGAAERPLAELDDDRAAGAVARRRSSTRAGHGRCAGPRAARARRGRRRAGSGRPRRSRRGRRASPRRSRA